MTLTLRSAGLVLALANCTLVTAAEKAASVSPAMPPSSRTFAVVPLSNPRAVAVDHAGNLYVGDVDASAVFKLSPAGVVTELSGSGSAVKDPIGVAVSRDGTVLVADADDNDVFKISAAGGITKLGQPTGGAPFTTPTSVGVNAAGEGFVTNNGNNSVLKISSGGEITLFAGKAGATGSTDGPASDARFAAPRGLAVDPQGNVYVADESSSTIRKITVARVVSTLAGIAGTNGSNDGAGVTATFSGPRALAVDTLGNVYVADTDNQTIRKITPGGMVSTLAGKAGEAGKVDGVGAAARFSEPRGITADSMGNIYVADSGNAAIRRITPSGVVTTVAGPVKP
jgi:streptogramin lyase